MLHFFWTLEFEAVQKGEMLPVFQILSLEAVDKGGMLSVFQILFSGRPQGGGNAVRFFFLPIFRALGGLKRGFRSLWKTLRSPGRGRGRVLGGWGVGCWGEKGRNRAHEHQTSFKTMFGGSESPKIDVLPR